MRNRLTGEARGTRSNTRGTANDLQITDLIPPSILSALVWARDTIDGSQAHVLFKNLDLENSEEPPKVYFRYEVGAMDEITMTVNDMAQALTRIGGLFGGG